MTKVLGILGTPNRSGLTAAMLQEVLTGAELDGCEVETLYLSDYRLELEKADETNEDLDKLHQKMLASDCIVLAAPTYWGNVSGVMKQFLDSMRSRLVRFAKDGEMLPDLYHKKKYILMTNCYTKKFENRLTGVTDTTFITMDRAFSTAGMERMAEIVCTDTFDMQELPTKKIAECRKVGSLIKTKIEKRDFTVKRYIQLFFMLAFSTLVTMGIQTLIGNWIDITSFFARYVSFVLIFFSLLSIVLHYFSVKKHKRS
ncbi:flavodoxin family protein [Carnobacterium gallinarum]|uniref:flavodoxin family protein n=1 Tax=Carnobacterium gallinarum TaxID=2749 RepID=UPI00054DAA0F|nr:flavodoxin family protein [Carnobacterium gallinarum]